MSPSRRVGGGRRWWWWGRTLSLFFFLHFSRGLDASLFSRARVAVFFFFFPPAAQIWRDAYATRDETREFSILFVSSSAPPPPPPPPNRWGSRVGVDGPLGSSTPPTPPPPPPPLTSPLQQAGYDLSQFPLVQPALHPIKHTVVVAAAGRQAGRLRPPPSLRSVCVCACACAPPILVCVRVSQGSSAGP